VLQAHKLRDSVHDIDMTTMDAKTVSEVRLFQQHYHHYTCVFSKKCTSWCNKNGFWTFAVCKLSFYRFLYCIAFTFYHLLRGSGSTVL